jgi:hypothetical protein
MGCCATSRPLGGHGTHSRPGRQVVCGERVVPPRTRQHTGLSRQASIQELLEQLNDAVQLIIAEIRGIGHPASLRVDDWSAKDTLGHIAFWHESFARNVSALANGRDPEVLEGTYPVLNQRGVEASRAMTVGRIAARIRQAQATIRRSIVKLPAETAIPYRKGSRRYSPEEHLVTVRGHIIAHLHRVERARRRRRRD